MWVAVVDVCATFLEVFTILCAILDGSMTVHCALALPARNRQKHVVRIFVFILILTILVLQIVFTGTNCP